ncbi:hypothetical protein Peur_015489 [Populus x canadensis]
MGLLGWLEQGLLANGHGGGMGVKMTVFVGRMRSCVAVAGTAVRGWWSCWRKWRDSCVWPKSEVNGWVAVTMGGCCCWISRGWLMIVKMERQLCWCCFGLSVWLGDTRFGRRTAIG